VYHTAQLLEGAFGDGWRERLATVQVVSIGPATSERCHAVLGRVDSEANPHDLEGLVAACGLALRARR
jgi:uroporphyrinogen-III synthase